MLVLKVGLLDFIPLFGLRIKILTISLGSIDFSLLVIVPSLLVSVESVLLLFVDSPLLKRPVKGADREIGLVNERHRHVSPESGHLPVVHLGLSDYLGHVDMLEAFVESA